MLLPAATSSFFTDSFVNTGEAAKGLYKPIPSIFHRGYYRIIPQR